MNIDEIDKIFSNANEINFYRIVQESLNNIVKHSKATQAFVSIKKENGYIHVEIKDNGTGFTKNESLNDGGLGITGMKERARILGAEFGIYSGKDGTKIKMDYQIKPAQENEK